MMSPAQHMMAHIQQAIRRKISDSIRLIQLEDGRVSHRHALTAAALVTTSALAGVLLAPQSALANSFCSCPPCGPGSYCCWSLAPCWTGAPGYECDSNGGMCG